MTACSVCKYENLTDTEVNDCRRADCPFPSGHNSKVEEFDKLVEGLINLSDRASQGGFELLGAHLDDIAASLRSPHLEFDFKNVPKGFYNPQFAAAVDELLKDHDPVNHPKHYTSHPSGVECITITRHMNFNLGNVIKYLWRKDDKGVPLQDLKKAAWYLNDEIEKHEGKKEPGK